MSDAPIDIQNYEKPKARIRKLEAELEKRRAAAATGRIATMSMNEAHRLIDSDVYELWDAVMEAIDWSASPAGSVAVSIPASIVEMMREYAEATDE